MAQARRLVRHSRGVREDAQLLAAVSDGGAPARAWPIDGIGFAAWSGMANQARKLEAASSKQNQNRKLAEVKELNKRPPLKPVPPPDEDVLYFLPIG